MKVKYIANTHVCLNVSLGNGMFKHVSFNPITGGKSIFYTEDEVLQAALESHYKYGKLFKRDGSAEKAVPRVARVAKPQEKKEVALREVKVSDLGLAREYLVTHYGVSRTKVKTPKQIESFARKNNLKFVGI